MKNRLFNPISLYMIGILYFSSFKMYAQESVWINKSEIKEIKIYQQGATVKRVGKANVNTGYQEVIFDGLSPYINTQSISVKGIGDATILSVSFQPNYLKEKKKSKEMTDLELLRDSLSYRLQQIKDKQNVLNELQTVLQANKSIKGETNGVLADELELVIEYYNKKLTAIKDDQLELSIKEKKVQEELTKVNSQIGILNQKSNQAEGNIIVRLDSRAKALMSFDLTYLIQTNVSWYSFYDIRAKDVSSPVELVHKAKVSQTTGEDWTNIKLKLSSGNPAIGNTKPELYPWYLSIYEPNQYVLDGRRYKEALSDAPAVKSEGIALASAPMNDLKVVTTQNLVNNEFDILQPYTIHPDGQEYQVEIEKFNVASSYEYVAIPKLDADAFLTARLTGWEELSLNPGNANIYLDGAYVGETYLNPKETNDTLVVSLGRDTRISVKRDKLKDLSGNKMFGGMRERSFAFSYTVKNNKKDSINLVVLDQLPLTTNKDIEVKLQETLGAEVNNETGEVKWKTSLAAGGSNKFNFSFTVKYPKDKQINGL